MDTLLSPVLRRSYNSNPITIEIKHQQIPTSELIPFLDPKRFNSYCKEGCPNYAKKWTCPPHCPPFEEYAKDYPFVTLFLSICRVNQFPKSDKEARSITAYSFTKENLQAWLREQEAPLGGRMLAANSCEICKTCSLEKGLPCLLPNQLRYDLVSFGFNVTGILENIFNHNIQWVGADNEPEYVTSVGALLFEEAVSEELLLNQLQ